jgi:hypothetical protein
MECNINLVDLKADRIFLFQNICTGTIQSDGTVHTVKEWLSPVSRYYLSIYVEEFKKITWIFNAPVQV